MHDLVVEQAHAAHSNHWRMSGDESTGDKLASRVTEEWQKLVLSIDPRRFEAEYSVAPHLKERIDLVDLTDGIAYEMKVSPNNVHMEFYRDIFKVILARNNRFPSLKRFVFLTPKSAAEKLHHGMGQAVIALGSSLALTIEVVAI